MSQRKELLTVEYHTDDETGMYHVGEIDFGISGNLQEYVKNYGYDGVKEVLATLGYLSYVVRKTLDEVGGKEVPTGDNSNVVMHKNSVTLN